MNFPDGRIELDNPVKQSNTIQWKLSDYAFGQFLTGQIAKLINWEDTYFVTLLINDLKCLWRML